MFSSTEPYSNCTNLIFLTISQFPPELKRDKLCFLYVFIFLPQHAAETHITRNPFIAVTFRSLSVGLGDTLELVLLLDGVRVGASLGGVDQLIGEALGDGLDVPEGSLAGPGAEEPDGLVHTPQGGHIDGLATDGTGTTDTGGVLTGSGVDDGVDQHLQGVLEWKMKEPIKWLHLLSWLEVASSERASAK